MANNPWTWFISLAHGPSHISINGISDRTSSLLVFDMLHVNNKKIWDNLDTGHELQHIPISAFAFAI